MASHKLVNHAERQKFAVTMELRHVRDVSFISPPENPGEQDYASHRALRISSSASTLRSSPFTSYENALQKDSFHSESPSHGATRFSAVFSENQHTFGSTTGDEAEDSRLKDTFASPEDPSTDIDTSQRELAIKTLLDFPTFRTCEILLGNLESFHDVWISHTILRQCFNQLWRDFGHCLRDDRSRETVLELADELFENSKHPIPSPAQDESSYPTWVNWFSGPQLRWESIGILFTWAGMSFKHEQDWDQIFQLPEQEGRNRNTSAEKMRIGAKACLQLSQDFSEINEVLIVLINNHSKLHSHIISDDSDRLQMNFGATGSAIITAGLHRQPFNRGEVTPLSQFRATLGTSFYHLDKVDSLFLGRPPILDQKYCSIPQPLDLADEDLYGGAERLAAAVKRLDANGWNTNKHISGVTCLRAASLLSPIREEIIRLSLSINVQYTKPQIDALIVQLEHIVASHPEHIRYSSRGKGSGSGQKRSPHEIYLIIRIQLDVLQCAFLLQRLLVSRGLSNGQDLFDVAQEKIAVVLSIWSDPELRAYSFAFDFIILAYGIPSAGILCLELLRASNLAPPMPASEALPHPTPVQLSRSEVIQTLTLFIAFLDYIRPTDNNFQLCGKFKKVVKRIIDTAIDAPRPCLTGPQPGSRSFEDTQPQDVLQSQQQVPDLSTSELSQNSMDFVGDLDPAMIALDDLDWLNTVDWTQGDWLELSQQNFMGH
ncbi:hypothetical protein VTL71DRAFT_6975 [Oculimacula yallundae]|uniref:Transcription factor domain-containing protein n=1 Tax=Oculimacula yallundae TaxID=86028 RepID=A0ABR4BXZ8_9HELO